MMDNIENADIPPEDNPGIMDEFQEFMKKSDERTEKYGQLMEKYADSRDPKGS